jgi:hypothetical protein
MTCFQAAILWFGVVLSFALTPSTAIAKPQFKCTGTFSSLEYNKEGGDLTGVELFVALTRDGYKGVLQLAEGEPGPLLLVAVECDGTTIHIHFVDEQGDSGEFAGVLSPQGLRGKFRFQGGGELDVKLRRKPSYWN